MATGLTWSSSGSSRARKRSLSLMTMSGGLSSAWPWACPLEKVPCREEDGVSHGKLTMELRVPCRVGP